MCVFVFTLISMLNVFLMKLDLTGIRFNNIKKKKNNFYSKYLIDFKKILKNNFCSVHSGQTVLFPNIITGACIISSTFMQDTVVRNAIAYLHWVNEVQWEWKMRTICLVRKNAWNKNVFCVKVYISEMTVYLKYFAYFSLFLVKKLIKTVFFIFCETE